MPEKLHPLFRGAAIVVGTGGVFAAIVFAIKLYNDFAWRLFFQLPGFFAIGGLFLYVGITGVNLRFDSSDEEED